MGINTVYCLYCDEKENKDFDLKDSLDKAGMVGGGHDGDLPEQHLAGLAVQQALVDDLDRDSFCMQKQASSLPKVQTHAIK
jgi:hypothetical protein